MKLFAFIKNAIILTITSFILRGLGLVLKVFLSNKIGAEGMGLYQLIFSVYILCATIATAGVSTGVIKVVTDEIATGTKETAIKAFRKCLYMCIFWSISLSFVVYFLASYIGKYLINDVRTIPSLKILVLAFPFMSITSCIKGYFTAYRRVSLPSEAQILEQIVRFIAIFFSIDYFMPYGIDVVCIAIIVADVISEMSSCLYSYFCYSKEKNRHSNISLTQPKNVRKKFLLSVYPIALNKYLNTSLRTFENMLIPETLRKFTLSREKSLAQFGMLKGMALPLLFFPSSLLTAFATLLIPEMAEAQMLNQTSKVKEMANRTFQITITVSILFAGIFFVFAYELAEVVYHNVEIGFIIKVLAPVIPFMYLETVVMGILQGLNQQVASLKYNIVDSIIRITLIYIFVPLGGMNSFLFIMVLSNITTSTLNAFKALKITNIPLLWKKWIIIPSLAVAFAIFVMIKITNLLHISAIIYIVLGSIIIAIIYATILLLTNSISFSDFKQSVK